MELKAHIPYTVCLKASKKKTWHSSGTLNIHGWMRNKHYFGGKQSDWAAPPDFAGVWSQRKIRISNPDHSEGVCVITQPFPLCSIKKWGTWIKKKQALESLKLRRKTLRYWHSWAFRHKFFSHIKKLKSSDIWKWDLGGCFAPVTESNSSQEEEFQHPNVGNQPPNLINGLYKQTSCTNKSGCVHRPTLHPSSHHSVWRKVKHWVTWP